jgi:8-oxo-dGTP pyrophosphatase MutT (NUDIX family)
VSAEESLRPAATILVVRDGPAGAGPLEVLMVRRNLRSDFVGGAYVFPGGTIDPSDSAPEVLARCRGRSDAAAAEALGLPGGGLAFWVGAVRECFEEAGLLLAATPEGARGTRLALHRAVLNAGSVSFAEVLGAEGLTLEMDRIEYLAHWITPVGAPKRYDTRFFVTGAPADQEAVHDEGETIDARWITPTEALRRHRDAEMELVLPTVRNLQAIGRYSSAEEVLAAAAVPREIPAICPRLSFGPGGFRLLVPGDDGYEAAAPTEGPGGRAGFDEAVRTVSRAANTPNGAVGA